MPTAKIKQSAAEPSRMPGRLKNYLNRDYLKKLAFDPHYVGLTCWCLLAFELVLNVVIVQRVNYTEIDWVAYMQEVQGFLNGTWDYEYLKGDTGPLVYPAGFVYIYSALYYITSQGTDIRLAQYIFCAIHLAQLYFTYEIFKKTAKIPPYALVLVALSSYRIHSIYVLRLFNDPIATLLFYISLNLLIADKWLLCSVFYSLAVSVKMNILLYSPALLLAYLTNLSYAQTLLNLTICAAIQLVLAAPFLITNPVSYVLGAFDLGRVFEHKWTVNYRFLTRDVFEDLYFHVGLLILHIVLLHVFMPHVTKYLCSYSTLRHFINDLKTDCSQKRKPAKAAAKVAKKSKVPVPIKKVSTEPPLSKDQESFLQSFEHTLKSSDASAVKQRRGARKPEAPRTNRHQVEQSDSTDTVQINFSKITQLLVLPFFVANLIGVTCARSLHYQFYAWYYHSLVYMVHCTPFGKAAQFLLLGVLEYCWNVYPSTDVSSALLHVCHVTLLYGLFRTMRQ